MRDLNNRVAAITGAGSGIGRALAVALGRQNCRLALSDIGEEGLAETAREVERIGASCTTDIVDVSDREQMQGWSESVVEQHRAVHIVINNAGVTADAEFLEQSIDDLEWVVGINQWGVVYGCYYFLPHLLAADAGHIVNISSIFGVIGVPRQTAYCMTKFAVRGLTESLWEELEHTNVRATCVHPGPIATNIARSARSYHEDDRERLHGALARGMTADDAAALIVSAIQQRQRRLLITREAFVADAIKRLVPAEGNKFIIKTMRRRAKV